jgi:hypothetical protein
MTPMGRDRAATATTAGKAVVLAAMEAATVVVAMIVAVMVLAIMMFYCAGDAHVDAVVVAAADADADVVALVPDAAVVVGRVVVAAADRILQDDPQTNTSAIRRYLPIMIGRS